MIIVENKFIPFDGFCAMTVYPFIFVRKDCKRKDREIVLNHEFIHGRQQTDVMICSLSIMIILNLILNFIIPIWVILGLPLCSFYLLYTINWIINFIANPNDPYKEIVFEREAYANEKDFKYLKKRKWYDVFKYFKFKKKKK